VVEADATERKSTKQNRKSVQAVSKQPPKGKLDSRYWKPRLFRNTYTQAGEKSATANLCIKVARAGRRETVNLGTSNTETAPTVGFRSFLNNRMSWSGFYR